MVVYYDSLFCKEAFFVYKSYGDAERAYDLIAQSLNLNLALNACYCMEIL